MAAKKKPPQKPPTLDDLSKRVAVLEAAASTPAVAYRLDKPFPIPSKAGVRIQFDEKLFDPDGLVDTGADWSFQTPQDGLYHFAAFFRFEEDQRLSNGSFTLMVNGKAACIADLLRRELWERGTNCVLTCTIPLKKGDEAWVEASFTHQQYSTRNLSADIGNTHFSAFLVRRR